MMRVLRRPRRNPSLGHLAVEKEKPTLYSTEGVLTEPTTGTSIVDPPSLDQALSSFAADYDVRKASEWAASHPVHVDTL